MEALVLVLVLVGILWAIVAANNAKRKALQDARDAYDKSLVALKHSPTDPDIKQRTLALGRHYSNLTREQKGVTIYDEVALSNDIGAACAGAAGHVVPSAGQSAEARMAQLKDLHTKGLVSDQEYDTQRRRILDNL